MIRYIHPGKKTYITLVALMSVLLLGCVGYYIVARSEQALREKYRAYDESAEKLLSAAYLPGASNNPVRRELGRVLAETLLKDMTAKERVLNAERGLALAQEYEAQTDLIETEAGNSSVLLAELQSVAALSPAIWMRVPVSEIITLAKERETHIQDIRGLSYRANFETAEIFRRVIADQGVLKSAYIEDLNRRIPATEEQFNRRTNLYKDVERLTEEIHEAAEGL